MRHRFRPLSALSLVLLLALSGCCIGSCGADKVENAVADVPVTLEDVKKRHQPPERTATVETVTESVGGGICAHHPVCLVVLPIMAYHALFPSKWQRAVIREGDKVVYEASFTEDGRFLSATVTDPDGTVRLLRGLHLKELGKTQVVVSARVAPGAKEATPVPLASQVDLPAEYRKAMGKGDAERRLELLLEAMQWLGKDAQGLMEERLKDPQEADSLKGAVMEKVCSQAEQSAPYAPFRAPALDAIAVSPGITGALVAMECLSGTEPEAKQRRQALMKAVLQRLCDPAAEIDGFPLSSIVEHPKRVEDAWSVSEARACAEPLTHAVLMRMLGQELSEKELDAAFASKRFETQVLAELLDLTRPVEREALVRALREHLGLSQEASLDLLARAAVPSSEAELEGLAQLFARDIELFGRSCPPSLMALLARASPDKVGPARARLRAALEKEENLDERAMLRAGLVLLGERELALPASRIVRGSSFGGKSTTDHCVASALLHAGCSEEALRKAVSTASNISEDARGALCTQPLGKREPRRQGSGAP